MSHLRSKVFHQEPLVCARPTSYLSTPHQNQDPSEASWKRLVKTTYVDPNGVERTWESAERMTRPADSLVDGVGIVAILEKPSGQELLLQKQYRPPLNQVVIETPAGMVDAGETVQQCAVRELREETGYVGVATKKSFIMYNDPGFCSTNFNMVHVKVDMSLQENQNPKPDLEENEFIDCFTLPLDSLYDELQKLEAEGYAIDSRVGAIAEGIEIAKSMKF
ncbi:hypothetical protein N7532_002743 [Penicillium argentinense]|uniref:Nudix hydrolase domain-containing protein n=1 Tax=Penicillium argentinense TaxID=1131581 RepID=A0A9W9KLR4_9EURO|nr:uncharacterized protein N7532_002743 [Penicillium argentinense]KAJ5110098.1 hypothetical protein N7532_002743 [Penicillium argentinense]